MEGLILTHIDKSGLRLFGPRFKERLYTHVESSLEQGIRVYNFQATSYSDPKLMHDERLVQIGYFNDVVDHDLDNNIFVQFLLGKKRIIEDGVDTLGICGWNIGVCISTIMRLMDGEDWGYFDGIGMTEQEYQAVVDRVIPIRMIPELSRH